MKGKILYFFVVGLIALFFAGCAANSGEKWKSDIIDDMQPEVIAGDYNKDSEEKGLDISFKQVSNAEGNYIQMIWRDVKLVPRDDPKASPFNAAKIRIASRAKEEAKMGKYLLAVSMANADINFSKSFNNPAIKFGEPYIDGYWGIGLGYNGLPGFLMIDPDSRWTVYKTSVFGGYKTKSGDKADLNTLLIGVVYYKNKSPRPLKEVLAEKGIKVGDFVSANKWGYYPELAEK